MADDDLMIPITVHDVAHADTRRPVQYIFLQIAIILFIYTSSYILIKSRASKLSSPSYYCNDELQVECNRTGAFAVSRTGTYNQVPRCAALRP